MDFRGPRCPQQTGQGKWSKTVHHCHDDHAHHDPHLKTSVSHSRVEVQALAPPQVSVNLSTVVEAIVSLIKTLNSSNRTTISRVSDRMVSSALFSRKPVTLLWYFRPRLILPRSRSSVLVGSFIQAAVTVRNPSTGTIVIDRDNTAGRSTTSLLGRL